MRAIDPVLTCAAALTGYFLLCHRSAIDHSEAAERLDRVDLALLMPIAKAFKRRRACTCLWVSLLRFPGGLFQLEMWALSGALGD